MCAPSPPPAPDYTAAAEATGAANIDAAVATARLNNPNISSVEGSRSVTYGGADSLDPTITETLSPENKAIWDVTKRSQLGLANVGEQAVGRVGGILGQSVDFSGAPAVGTGEATRNKVYEAMMSRANQDFGRADEAQRSKLVAAGIPVGSEAWNNEMQRLDRARTDTGLQAQLASGQEARGQSAQDMEARRQFITELLAQRQTPMNEISALMSGSQVGLPQFQAYGGGGKIGGVDYSGAAQQQYGAGMDSYNAQAADVQGQRAGLFSLGSAAVGNPSFKF